MERVKQAVHLVLLGIKDCFCGILSLANFLFTKDSSSHQNRQRFSDSPQKCVLGILWQCFVFNFLLCICNYIFTNVLLDNVFMQFVTFMREDLESAVLLKNFLYVVFFIAFILPLIFISKILNFFWYQEMANLTFVKTGIRKNTNISFSEFYANESKSFILQTLYCVQAYVVYLLPLPETLQTLWYLIHLSLLTSLYAFEYKWVHMGWVLPRRLLTIDRKWPYFLGYGLPLAVLSTFAGSFSYSMIIFNAFFALYVMSSNFTNESQSPAFIYPLHSFKIVDCVTDAGVYFFLNMFFGVKNIRR